MYAARCLFLCLLAMLLASWPDGARLDAQKPAEPKVLPVGMVDSLLNTLSPAKRELLDTDLPKLVKEFTGVETKLSQGGDPFAAGKKLASGEWRLGFFPGVEFAWAQAKDAKLRPLLLVIDRHRHVHALVVAKKDSPFQRFEDLKGKNVRVFKTNEASRLFAKKGAAGEPAKFFGKYEENANAPDALDDVLRGKIDAAVLNETALEDYQSIYPGRFDRLKVVAKSPPFPPVVIGYYEGGLSDATLDKLRQGMSKANESQKGRDSLANVGMTALELAPADFTKLLESVRKEYP